ncbi:MAG: molybdate ABC transporter substrate-binding protein [Burkholderiaceae bacterium]
MKVRSRFIALLFGCGLSLSVAAQTLTVSAAASLQNALREVGTAYQATHPGTRIDFNFGASGSLLAQIAKGAPADVFASADLATMDRAQARNLIDVGSRANFVANQMLVISPRSAPAHLKAAADLKGDAIRRIAVGSPASVPAGRYAKEALERDGLWADLVPKLVFAENVRQALNYVSRAEVDAGLVYRTDAKIDAATVRIDFAFPTVQPLLYPVARVAASPNVKEADAFIAYLQREPAQAVFERFGFRKP